MANTVQMNVLILPETRRKIEELTRLTYRSKGDLIDWLVAEAHAKNYRVEVSTLPCPEVGEPVPLVTISPDSVVQMLAANK